MLTVTTVLICITHLTNGILGKSCETKPMPTTAEIVSCCDVTASSEKLSPKQEEMTEHARACHEIRRNEYDSLSEDEMKQMKGKFGEYKCMPECFYRKGGIVNEDGTLNKKNFIELTAETFTEMPIQEKAVAAITKCTDKMDQTNICSESKGLLLATRCFMAEMILNCPQEKFNNTEICQNSREYLKTCEEEFIQKTALGPV